ncbi:FBD-associated F-box protein At4g10400-like isoform X2 [Vicia villosa]|uniref:FBD-associated F-box protein At4g10400-like isoform X2 n=1 Tax=Vicia villosa TaxID=3911 RepID=UPI00273BD3C9|nr:FBD-associated F-box protein At4g10400-like isoform X2 [Vicia villosa]
MHSGSLTSCASAGRHENEHSKRRKSREGQDMISNLPDFIIAHILSFLPTKFAVCTSVLSWRWIYMWTFVTKLSFNDKELPFSYPRESEKTRFMNFVYRVLLHLNSASIKEFSLEISQNLDSYHINQWISAVSNKSVKKISIWSLYGCNLSSYPLLKCQSLEKLVLKTMDRFIIKVSTLVRLSSLTVLNLIGVTFTCYGSNEPKELTLNLPVLRKFKILRCTWLNVKSVTVEAPLLEVVSLSYNESLADIKFCVLHLKKFYYCGKTSAETVVLDAEIDSTNIELLNLKEENVEETFICQLLRINAKCLKLYLETDWENFVGLQHYLDDIPAFGMLRYLEMTDFDKELSDSAIVPDCFLSTLKEVEFENISGYKWELNFAKFVMENACVLEKISFSFSDKLQGLELEKVKEKLVLIETSCNIVFIEYV